MKIKGTTPQGQTVVYEHEWVQRHMEGLAALFRTGDVVAITIHRTDGDHRYEQVTEDGRDGVRSDGDD